MRGSTMPGRFVVNVVPGDRVVPAAGRGSTHGKDKALVEGSLKELCDLSALRAVWKVGGAGHAVVPLPGVRMLLRLDPSGDDVVDDDGSVSLVPRQRRGLCGDRHGAFVGLSPSQDAVHSATGGAHGFVVEGSFQALFTERVFALQSLLGRTFYGVHADRTDLVLFRVFAGFR